MLRKFLAAARDPVLWILVAVIAIILITGFGHAYAQAAAPQPTNAPIVIPWGNLLYQLIVILSPEIVGLVALGLAWIFSKLPAQLVTNLKAAHADTLLNRAVNQAIALVEGAVKGKTVSVTVANQLINTATSLLVQNAPWLVNQLGTRLGTVIAGKLADLNMLDDKAHAGNLNVGSAPITANPPKAVAQ